MSYSVTGRPRVAAIAEAAPRMQRRLRRPAHSAYLHFVPHVLTPFLFHPVLPGETLKNALMQARVLTTPVKGQLTGWWLETYWFYVKHRHLENGPDLMQMMLDLDGVPNADAGSDKPAFYVKSGDQNFAQLVYNCIVDEFFRGDGENSVTAEGLTADGLAKVRLKLPGWWDSIVPESTLVTPPGIGTDTIGSAALDTVGEVARAIETYNHLRMLGVTNLEYDDWLRSFGVRIAAPVEDRPELIRYTREWQLPSNAVSVDATSQRVSSVLSWSLTERIDKDRRFKEPGFLMACIVARPKMYHSGGRAGASMLTNAMAWQSPFATGQYDAFQPVGGLSGYLFDTRDLYNHGDQWVYTARGTAPPLLTFPTDGQFDYPADADVDALFVDGSSGHVKADIAVSLAIASGAVGSDATPATV
jgi:hypothetical protein